MSKAKKENAGANANLVIAGETLESLTLEILGFYDTIAGEINEIGRRLWTIKKHKLYKSKYHRFGDYCAAELPFGSRRAYEVIDVESIVQLLPESVRKSAQKESHIEALKGVPADKLEEVWISAHEAAESENRDMTARDVESFAAKFIPAKIHAKKRTVEKKARGIMAVWKNASLESRRNFVREFLKMKNFEEYLVAKEGGIRLGWGS